MLVHVLWFVVCVRFVMVCVRFVSPPISMLVHVFIKCLMWARDTLNDIVSVEKGSGYLSLVFCVIFPLVV